MPLSSTDIANVLHKFAFLCQTTFIMTFLTEYTLLIFVILLFAIFPSFLLSYIFSWSFIWIIIVWQWLKSSTLAWCRHLFFNFSCRINNFNNCCMGIPIMANFNLFFNPSLKVSRRYMSFGCCGIITHNCKIYCNNFLVFHVSNASSSLKATMSCLSLHTSLNLEINARETSP